MSPLLVLNNCSFALVLSNKMNLEYVSAFGPQSLSMATKHVVLWFSLFFVIQHSCASRKEPSNHFYVWTSHLVHNNNILWFCINFYSGMLLIFNDTYLWTCSLTGTMYRWFAVRLSLANIEIILEKWNKLQSVNFIRCETLWKFKL